MIFIIEIKTPYTISMCRVKKIKLIKYKKMSKITMCLYYIYLCKLYYRIYK